MATAWSNIIADWQGVDNKPTAGSNNLVNSGGVAEKLTELESKTGKIYSKNVSLLRGIAVGYENASIQVDIKKGEKWYVKIKTNDEAALE